jgi:hypothetical protein
VRVEAPGAVVRTTDAQGRFTLPGVAAGTRSVSVAHPRHGSRATEVAVDAGADQGCGVVLMWTQAEPTPGQ